MPRGYADQEAFQVGNLEPRNGTKVARNDVDKLN